MKAWRIQYLHAFFSIPHQAQLLRNTSLLQDLGFQVWIMGVISGCALGVSFLLAVIYLCVTIFSGAGRHYRFISTPAA